MAVCLAAHAGSGGKEQLEETMQVGMEGCNMTVVSVRKCELTDM